MLRGPFLRLMPCLLLLACRSDDPDKAEKQDRPGADEPAPAAAQAPERAEPTPSSEGPPVRKDGTIFGASELMGTQVSLNVYVGPKGDAAGAGLAMQAALNEMARIEDIMSEWREGSELSKLNDAAGGDPVRLSDELFEVLQRSHEISERSEGAFDVTFHGVGQLWSFRPGARPPSRAQVAAHLPLVDWKKLVLDPDERTARLGAGMKIGLGAIAKGYAVDRASAVLTARGFTDHVVEAGGDTYASGRKGDKPWMVGVQDPHRNGAIGALPAVDVAVVTSGDYQRFFEFEGKRYAHILDPRTGWPVDARRSPRSVTVVAANATDADGYCTAIAVMGSRLGFEFAEQLAEIEAVIIAGDGSIEVTSGLRDRFVRAGEQTSSDPP